MFSGTFVPFRLLRNSARKETLKLWVKHNGSPSTQVPIKGCNDIDDFAQKVKKKLNTKNQVALFTSLEKEALFPGLAIKDLLKTDDFKNNSGESPLFVKITPVPKASIATKTIYIGETNKHGKFTGEYKQRKLRNDQDLMLVINRAHGLIHPSMPKRVLISFVDIKDGEQYHLYQYGQGFQSWQKQEAVAMDAETLLSMKTYLMEKLLASSIDLPTDLYDSKGTQIQEWDGVLLSGDTLFLLDAKHSMSVEKVKEMAGRVKRFPQIMELSKQKELNIKYNKIVGVACGTQFPVESRMEARRLGIMIVYPSGRRYLVESDKIDFDYAIER